MKRLLASCLGLGRLPIAPGTWGSVPPAAVFALLSSLAVPATGITVAMAGLTLLGSIICVTCAPAAVEATEKKDPGEVVADEFAGQSAAFLVLSITAANMLNGKGALAAAAIGFFIFRLFDVAKPWPIRKLEKLPGGWGILADDLLAGIYAGVAASVILNLWMLYNVPLD